MRSRTLYEFGGFHLDPSARILQSGDRIVPLTPKCIELLIVLVERHNHVVSKDDLIKAVWPDTFVEESNLTSNMSTLRKQLGALPEGGEYIATIPKRGYRFIAKVAAVETTVSAPSLARLNRWTAGGSVIGLILLLTMLRPGPSPKIAALAVLPLTNLSGDPAQEYFTDGITEALITDLSQIASLRVISRTSVMRYKNTHEPLADVASQLKVDAVIRGSVMRSGQRVRITAELIQISTNRHLWTRTYERDLGDILDLQNEIVRGIASEVKARLTPSENARLARSRPSNPEAYEAFLKGRHYWNQFTDEQSLLKSIEYFDQSILLNPNYPEAYAGLADSWNMLQYSGADPSKSHPHAKEAAAKALQLDDSLAEAHAAMSLVKALEFDWAESDREVRRALELNPGYVLAHSYYSNQLRHRGRFEESIAEARRALDLDPLSPWANEGLADAHLSARQYDRAIEQYRKTLDLYPTRAVAHNSLGWAYIYCGQYEEGLEEIRVSVRSYGEDPELSPELAYVDAAAGRKAKARKTLQRLLNLSKQVPLPPHHFALIYAGLGDKEEALLWLEQAYQQHSAMMSWLKVDPRFDGLRPDPRFQDLMRRVGLL